MSGKDHYLFLQEAFVATFMDELLPGIFHNFANPLNGIMGRSKLMQRRLIEFVKKIEKRYPGIEEEMGAEYAKLVSDVNSINNESDKFYNMFCVSTGKFYAIGSQIVEKINLSNLVEAELGFADFYLDFKHNIKKEIRLDRESPDIEGGTAFYSMALWMLIRQAMINIKETGGAPFFIATDHDDQWVILKITYVDDGVLHRWLCPAEEGGMDLVSSADERGEESHLLHALLLLRQGNDTTRITYDEDGHMLTIQIPYQKIHRRPEV
jgi:hypothetical protein